MVKGNAKSAARRAPKDLPLAWAAAPIAPPAAELKGTGGPETAPDTSDNAGSAEKAEVVQLPRGPGKELLKKLVEGPASVDAAAHPPAKGNGSGDFCGTTVEFVASPKLAAEQALQQHKLLFVLHLSGNFEDPGFT